MNVANIESTIKGLTLGISDLEVAIILDNGENEAHLINLRAHWLAIRAGLVKAKNAINKYGQAACVQGYEEHIRRGEGAYHVGGGNVSRGDALIAGGQYLVTGNALFYKQEFHDGNWIAA